MHFGDLHFLSESSIDFIRKTYAPTVFSDPKSDAPTLRLAIKEQIHQHILLIEQVAPVKRYFIKGSILTKQYNQQADVDIFVQIRHTNKPNLENDIQEVWKKIDGIYAKNTTHPLQYYITTIEYDLKNTEAAYDVKNDKWLSQIGPKELELSKYTDELKNKLNRLDMMTGELRRDVIDHEMLKSIPEDQVDGVEQKIKDKLKEVEYDIKALIKSYNEIKGARNKAFGQEMTPDELAHYGRKTHLPGNVIFKFIERYHYLDTLRTLRKIFTDSGELDLHWKYDKLLGTDPILKDIKTEDSSMSGWSSNIDALFDIGATNKAKFDDKFRPDGTPKARHMKGMTGINRSTGQNLIPDIYKVDPTANSKVEQLRKLQTGMVVLNGNDIRHIVNTYSIKDLTPTKPKQLGRSGITIFYNPNLQTYCIKK